MALRNMAYLDYLNKWCGNYALLLADDDEAVNNVIVVCRKFYLDVV